MSPPPEIPSVDLMRRRLSLTTVLLAATPLGWARPIAPKVDADMDAGTLNTPADLVANRSTRAGELLVSHVDLGPPDGQPVLLLHGWPYDIQTYAEATRLLVRDGYRVIVPYLRGHGRTSFLSTSTPRNGQQSVLATDAIALLDALRIKRAIIGGCDWGARTANVIAALWPERCDGLVSVSGYLIGSQDAGRRPLPPESELSWWYQFYFATERGRIGYAQNRREFARLIWRLASPRWRFDDATFDRSASALENPDHVAVVVHNYRWRLGLVSGDPALAGIEARLSKSPLISIPSITLEGDANGAPHPLPDSYAGKFTGPYEHRNVIGGIGHNLPQEAPVAFAKAIRDVTSIGAG
jgi:pimeloyl-ACP methyl ester carboxylesterase